MKKKFTEKSTAVDFMLSELKKTMAYYDLPRITQREYFGLSEVSEFFMRKWGINFSDLKSLSGLANNTAGKKVTKITSISPKRTYEKEFSSFYLSPVPTGKVRHCLKCNTLFAQTNYNFAVCVDCDKENKMTYSERSNYEVHIE